MKKNYLSFNKEKLLIILLRLGALFFILLAIIHLSDMRFSDVSSSWNEVELSYAKLLTRLFGSFSLAFAFLCWFISKDINRYAKLVLIAGVWALFHAVVLFFSTITNEYNMLFTPTPSLKVWIPNYNINLGLEGILASLFGILAVLWYRERRNETNN